MRNALAKAAGHLGLTRSTWLRHVALGILARVGQRDAKIRHHWVRNRSVTLHCFRHKGYWFYGRAREQKIMHAFGRLIGTGDTVIELGAHIGYISIYFASLVGEEGLVYVFEPSPDNLPYTRRNLAGEPNVRLIEMAANDSVGSATFFVEELTGQNSTLVENYSVFNDNRKRAFSNAAYRRIEVPTTTVDLFAKQNSVVPNFIKIDVEGAELACLQGAVETLKRFHPRLMVEVTRDRDALFSLTRQLGYEIYDSDFKILASDTNLTDPNFFFIHRNDAVLS